MPGGALPVVIHAARTSPSAKSEEENPEPLHPLATQVATPGTGPATNRPSGFVNSPPRCSATGALGGCRGLGGDLGA